MKYRLDDLIIHILGYSVMVWIPISVPALILGFVTGFFLHIPEMVFLFPLIFFLGALSIFSLIGYCQRDEYQKFTSYDKTVSEAEK